MSFSNSNFTVNYFYLGNSTLLTGMAEAMKYSIYYLK